MGASGYRVTIAPTTARPFDARLSAHLDLLIVQLESNPPRWKRQILRLRKLIAGHRAMGRAG